MKRGIIALGGTLLVGGAGVSIAAFQHVPRIAQNTFVGPIEVGGLTHEDAAKKLRLWWETQRRETLVVEAPGVKNLPPMTPGMLGVTLDDAATVDKIPLQDFMSATIVQGPPKQSFPLVYKPNGYFPEDLAARLKTSVKTQPATVRFMNGSFLRRPEAASSQLDRESVVPAVIQALQDGGPVSLQIETAPKKVPDDALAEIKDVVASFTTTYKVSQRDRSVNLKTASSRLQGIVLMPGEKLSFNQAVGERTLQNGYREAIVFEEGRQTPGVGGGICQVSSTLYNAALFANLKIVQRRNHSIPVPYVGLGRDATVYWGVVDLVIENNYETPIAVDSQFEPGKLTVRVLGKKDPSLDVKVVTSGLASHPSATRTTRDPNLPAGTRKVVQKGTGGKSINSYRLVYRNGKLEKRESLGRSHYRGEVTIVAVGSGRGSTIPKMPTTPPPSVDSEPITP